MHENSSGLRETVVWYISRGRASTCRPTEHTGRQADELIITCARISVSQSARSLTQAARDSNAAAYDRAWHNSSS